MPRKKAFVIGIDCLTPQYYFGEYLKDLPFTRELLKRSLWGRMHSTIPPITCPAWASMVTGKDPGVLGMYGFRNKVDRSYERLTFSTSDSIKEKTIWDIIAKDGKQSIAVAIPPSFPPKAIHGIMVGCFLTPDTTLEYTYPRSVKQEIEREVGEYLIDVKDFRTENKDYLLDQVYKLSENRFRVVEYLMKNKPWDFFMFVDMGVDRFHHGFWKYIDKTHSKFEPGNKYENALRDYYRFLDGKIGNLVKSLDDDTTVYIVSDHGAQKIDGGFCVNEWLIQKGYLTLKNYPEKPVRLTSSMVDWAKTKAWGEGGYYARIFFNVKGREPQGIIEPGELDAFKRQIISEFKKIRYINSGATKTVVHEAGEIYPKINGIPPDLFVFFGDLLWRSVGSVGYKEIYTFENDTGPDDANHDYHGVFVMHHKAMKEGRDLGTLSIYDVAPTILKNMGYDVPSDMKGRAFDA